jgi:sugar phosphate isomerase/epimerase
MSRLMTRRESLTRAACGTAVAAAGCMPAVARDATPPARWQANYILSSALYGDAPLASILPEVAATGASSIDLWPPPHGTQRDEIDSLGLERVEDLLRTHAVRLGGIACYRPGAFNLASEFALVRRLGDAQTVLVTMAKGDGNATGTALDAAIREFLEKLQPAIEEAEAGGGVIAIENHSGSLLKSPESIHRFAKLVQSEKVGLALAPHHLPQEGQLLADLAAEVGGVLKFVYAQQLGHGSSQKLPKDEELLQLPGRGVLDFGPLMRQLAEMNYAGPIEIFMHPVPRGVPILPTLSEITAAVNASRAYLDGLL